MNGTNEQPLSSDVAEGTSEQVSVATPAAPVGDQVWDALQYLRNEVVAYNVAPAALIPHLRDRELIAKVKNPQELVRNAQLLNNDVTSMRGQLEDIYNKHRERSGSSTDADDQLAAIQIHEDYVQWTSRYDSVVVPTIITMMESLLDAGAELDQDRLNARMTDLVGGGLSTEPVDLDLDAGSFEPEVAETANV